MKKTTRVELAECPRCGWTYDAMLLHPLVGSMFKRPICAICAREVRRAMHGVDIPFRGLALEAYEDAVAWRKEHPSRAPSPAKETP